MIIWVVMIFGGIAGGFFLDKFLFPYIHNNLLFHILSFIIGVVLLFIVLKVSKNTGRTLAKYGRQGDLPRMETNALVREGVYKYMRHPMHLGLLFFPLSVALLVGSPSFILIISPAEIIFMLVMIKFVEERQAIEKFGEEYREYMRRVSWFCFKPKCLKELLRDIPKN
jgi:protein-S-isoprenylcysteine O-methyltransferase Ste14